MSDSATLWTITHQAPLPMGFSRQDYLSREERIAIPSSRGTSQPRDQPASLTSPTLADRFFNTFVFTLADRLFTTSATWEATQITKYLYLIRHSGLGIQSQRWFMTYRDHCEKSSGQNTISNITSIIPSMIVDHKRIWGQL